MTYIKFITAVAAASCFVATSFTAQACERKAEQVEFAIDVSQSHAQIIADVEAQAKAACASDTMSGTIESKFALNKKCERKMVADVMQKLEVQIRNASGANEFQMADSTAITKSR